MLNLFVLDAEGDKVPVYVSAATPDDLRATAKWQTQWTSKAALEMPNKVALRRTGTNELLGLMAYIVDGRSLAVEIVYVESVDHSNTNLLRVEGRPKKYIGIAKAPPLPMQYLFRLKMDMTGFWYSRQRRVNWWHTTSVNSAQAMPGPMVHSGWSFGRMPHSY